MDEETLKQIARQLRQPEGDQGVQVGIKMNEGNLHINRFAIEALSCGPGDAVLEIGMGNGFFVKDILSEHPSIHYTGCDFSAVMIEQAQACNQNFIEERRANFILASAEMMPFEDNSFEKILTVNTLYFWDRPSLVLEEIHRTLKRNGSLVIAIRPKSVMEKYPFTKYDFRMYSDVEVRKMLESHRFKVREISLIEEPDQQIAGEKFAVQSIIVTARKV